MKKILSLIREHWFGKFFIGAFGKVQMLLELIITVMLIQRYCHEKNRNAVDRKLVYPSPST